MEKGQTMYRLAISDRNGCTVSFFRSSQLIRTHGWRLVIQPCFVIQDLWCELFVLLARENESSRYCHDVRPSVRLGRALWSYNGFKLWLESPVFCATLYQSMSTYSQLSFFPVSFGRKMGVDVQTKRDISRTVEDRG